MSDEPVEVKLRQPIKAHGETVKVLTLRPPTGREIRMAGYPFRIGGDADGAEMDIQAGSISKLIGLLADIPPSSVDLLSASDWQGCMTAVLGFFGASDLTPSSTGQTSSTAGSSVPDGGATPASSGT